MNFKKSLLIALFSFGITQSAFAETDSEKLDRAVQFYNQRNYSAAFPLSKQLAEQGNAKAQFNLGFMYANGKGVAQSGKQAVYWYTKAAEQGYAAAQYNLGVLYERGWSGLLQDLSKAKHYYDLACDGGEESGCRNYAKLGIAQSSFAETNDEKVAEAQFPKIYSIEQVVGQSDKQAVYWYTKAAEQGDAKAQRNLGVLYEHGWLGLLQDLSKAKHYYSLACDGGEQRGCRNYARLGIAQSSFAEINNEKFARAVQFYKQQNYSVAFSLFKQLAEQGDVPAQFNLGMMYEDGKGVAQSDKQAVYWYTKAAEQGLAQAQNHLGFMYDNGQGVDQSDKQAVYWYTKAAEQGNKYAQFNLGNAYYNGEGVAQSDKQAVYWYTKAAEQGLTDAQYSLGIMYYGGEGVQKDLSKAKQLFKQACEKGNAIGCKNYKILDKQGIR